MRLFVDKHLVTFTGPSLPRVSLACQTRPIVGWLGSWKVQPGRNVVKWGTWKWSSEGTGMGKGWGFTASGTLVLAQKWEEREEIGWRLELSPVRNLRR